MKPTTRHDIVKQGQSLYEQAIRPRLEPAQVGQFVVLDVESGEYEMDANKLMALNRLMARQPRAVPYIVRVGRPTAVTLGKKQMISTFNYVRRCIATETAIAGSA